MHTPDLSDDDTPARMTLDRLSAMTNSASLHVHHILLPTLSSSSNSSASKSISPRGQNDMAAAAAGAWARTPVRRTKRA